jgi:hypothetical protein
VRLLPGHLASPLPAASTTAALHFELPQSGANRLVACKIHAHSSTVSYMADFVDKTKQDIQQRLDEIKPLVEEYRRLEAALQALTKKR